MFFRIFSFCLLSLLVTTVPRAAPDDLPPNRCRSAGEVVLTTWHKLSMCVRRQVLTKEEVAETQALFKKTYPKLSSEVQRSSSLSRQARLVANSLPYDFRDSRNTELLRNICETSNSFLHTASTQADWKTELACWQ